MVREIWLSIILDSCKDSAFCIYYCYDILIIRDIEEAVSHIKVYQSLTIFLWLKSFKSFFDSLNIIKPLRLCCPTSTILLNTKKRMICCIKNYPKELFILLNVIHFIERKIWLSSCSEDTKKKSILGIYYCHDKLLIFNYSKWSILNISFLILDGYLIR